MDKHRYEKGWQHLCCARKHPAGSDPSEPLTEDESDGLLVRARDEARSVVIYPSDTVAELMSRVESLLADNRRLRAALEPVAYHLQTLRGKYAGAKRSDLTYIFSPGHADAVLAALARAAAGGEGDAERGDG